jgi:hypothetical protein
MARYYVDWSAGGTAEIDADSEKAATREVLDLLMEHSTLLTVAAEAEVQK